MIDNLRVARVKAGLSGNQAAETIKVMKLVFRWAERRELITRNRVVLYRFKIAKEDRRAPIPEYHRDDFSKLLLQFDPRSSRYWRALAVTAICGTQGARINAVLHLRWEDIDFETGRIRWRGEWDKMGHEREQPLTSLAREALYVALGWSQNDLTRSGWVFYTPKSKKHDRGDHVYHVSSYWRMLCRAETGAGIPHVTQRAAHGLRRMAAGNVLELTNNPVTAMQWIGDTDLSMAKRYLKKRDETLQSVADRIHETPAPAADSVLETATQAQRTTQMRNAPRSRGALTHVKTPAYRTNTKRRRSESN
ncbi:MAG: site-specific integrase [Gemmatimonadaceae bacterium]